MPNKMNRNQEGVVFNRHQGDAVKALFVCSAGILRSPTAALHFAKTKGWNTRAVGDREEFALIPLSEALLYWADVIFVMNAHQQLHIKLHFGESFADKIFVLNIEDDFGFMDPDLVKYLEASMEHLMPEVEGFLKTKK
jgi:predicted protein tyrosine phosphatase